MGCFLLAFPSSQPVITTHPEGACQSFGRKELLTKRPMLGENIIDFERDNVTRQYVVFIYLFLVKPIFLF